MLLRIDRRTCAPSGKKTYETRYFLKSLAPEMISPERLRSLIRGHWQIENNLHFMKDRWWVEDRHWLRRPGLAPCCATLLNAALKVLRQTKAFPDRLPLRARADELAATPTLALQLLGANT